MSKPCLPKPVTDSHCHSYGVSTEGVSKLRGRSGLDRLLDPNRYETPSKRPLRGGARVVAAAADGATIVGKMGRVLNLVGVVSGPLFLFTLAQAVNLSYSGGSHEALTYLVWWSVTGALLVVAALYWFWGRKHLDPHRAVTGDSGSGGGHGGDASSAEDSSAASTGGSAISNPQVGRDLQSG